MKAENSNEFESGYRKGFYDGILEGQKGGIEIASNAIATSVRPIQIQMPDSETARLVAKGLRAEQAHPTCETCGNDKETSDVECKMKHYVSYCSNHTELHRLKGAQDES